MPRFINIFQFFHGSVRVILTGGKLYYSWIILHLLFIIWGGIGYANQIQDGLIITNMRDSVSWGFYIGNFTFLVGIAAASVMLVIPAYIYDWKQIREIMIFGELLAICSIIMACGFILVDIGQPHKFWHILPLIGTINFPDSMMAWDFFIFAIYVLILLFLVTYILYKAFYKKEYNKSVVWPFILLSIPAAIAIHTITAFLYSPIAARPFWNSALLAPRFLASAFCSGPVILIILLQILRKTTNFEIKNRVIWRIAEFMVYAMFVYLFFSLVEYFKEFYSNTQHRHYWNYLLFGIGENKEIVLYSWSSIIMGFIAFVLFLIPYTRKNLITLNIGAVLIFLSVYIEKGMALIIPGFTPDALGQIYIYTPSMTEIQTTVLIFFGWFFAIYFYAKNRNCYYF